MSLSVGMNSGHWLDATARVDALLPEGVRVSVLTQSGCAGCASRQGCGTGLLATKRKVRPRQFTIATSSELSVGQTVRIGLPARRFLEGALAIYGLPLAMSLLAGGAAEAWLKPGHPLVPVIFLAGLACGVLGLALWGRYQSPVYRPVLLDPSPP
ncbi:SoxR reducing system RseC family protein [Halomonas sp. I5-271120]|uniref:SoxR reducing system RseC family protein n=1 Tax=Halomonas sp. I5-271120 TaxID=3061632 RepID=UPI0027147848|nr:SoxR reducing system RseC family protein [Halomonas sp. I5-271120]